MQANCREFNLEQGDSIRISPYGGDDEYTLKVAGIIRSVSENIVMSPEYAGRIGIDYVIDSVYTDTPKADIKADGVIKSVQSKQAIIDSFDSFMEIMNLMIVIFILAAAVLGVVVLYNLGVMSYTEKVYRNGNSEGNGLSGSKNRQASCRGRICGFL